MVTYTSIAGLYGATNTELSRKYCMLPEKPERAGSNNYDISDYKT